MPRPILEKALLASIFLPTFMLSECPPGEFCGPSVDEFFPEPILFAGTPFELNRVLLIRVIAFLAVVVLLWLATRALKVVPGRGQVAAEFILGFVRQGIVFETLGERDGKRFLPLLMTIFFLTLGLNLTGTIPGLQIPSTGLIGQALLLAVIAYVTFIYAGIRRHGLKFFKNATVLPGVPLLIMPIIAILEALSTFIIRPVTLTLRLTMNVVAGHMLLALCFLATNFFFFTVLAQGNFLGLIGVGTFAFGVAFTVLEIFVAALQAYVFTILTAIYIQMALADEH
ncbi:MAG: F0F1 ATP synthase subunit A [Pseudolysinimonas sp.]|uniref:F0F1 ATP synthase subunit A n=1 Tax=Pseudolysinimonas sp. TaxID=2680009 RepID=UPI0032663975